jgi:class 3 adenylate cyclase
VQAVRLGGMREVVMERALTETGVGADWTLRGYPAVQIRIGLSTGMALVGNLGSQERLRCVAPPCVACVCKCATVCVCVRGSLCVWLFA